MLPIVRALDRHRAMLVSLSFLVLCLAVLTGCGKTDSAPHSQVPTRGSQPAPILKFHWLGKNRLATEANATNFMAIWNLPESAKLEAQTLDKLASAPWRLWQTNVAVSNAPAALLRPMLEDLVNHEVYVEAQGDTNQPAAFVLAIRLPADRSALWQTNLPLVLNSLFPNNLNPSSPSPIFHLPSADVTLSRSNDWTLLSFTPSPLRGESRGEVSASANSDLLTGFRNCIAACQFPPLAGKSNQWVQMELDWPRLKSCFNLPCGAMAGATQIVASATGEGNSLRSTVDLFYSQPVVSTLPAWNIPTNFIHDPLIAFSAVRGAATLLNSMVKSNILGSLELPPQLFSWAVAGYPLQTYFAAPQPQATNAIRLLSAAVRERLAAPEHQGFLGRVVTATNFESIELQGFPFMTPRLQGVQGSGGDFLLGGFVPLMRTNKPIPAELIAQVIARPNLIYYDWEITGPRVEAWVYISQTLRLIFRRAQLPTDSSGLKWLQALMPHVGNSATAISAPSSRQVSFVRTASIGFTGVELHLLTDWLESPRFPLGYHTEQPQPMRKSASPPPPPPADKK